MPEPLKAVDSLRGHWTKEQIEKRRAAEAALFRSKVSLIAPKEVKNNPAAKEYWKNTIERMKGISLLDDLDTDMLAAYCLQSARRDILAKIVDGGNYSMLPRLQSQERLILSYANKLGLTAESRVRIAKRRADKRQIDPDGEMFD